MNRRIIFCDGVLFDDGWHAIDPTGEELDAIRQMLAKYESLEMKQDV